MIQAVVSDFGGVLTSPLLDAFERVQDGIDVRPEMYRDAMAYCLSHDGVHPLFAVERGEISEREFLARVERGLAETAGVRVSLHGFGEQLMSAMGPNWEAEPEIYAITLERLGLPAAACAFVDDLEHNVEGAREAGMHGIVFRDNAQAIAELTSLLTQR